MTRTKEKIEKLSSFYQKEIALVTSPFINNQLELNTELFEAVCKKLGISFNGKRILDIGCGSGQLAQIFQNHSFYCGIDLNDRKNFQDLKDENHYFCQANALNLPFLNRVFDIVICMDSFEHFPDQFAAVKEIYSILKPGGIVLLSVPTYANVAGLVKWWCEKYGKYEKNTWAPFDFWKPEELEHFITPNKITTLFKRCGFVHLKKIGYDEEAAVGLFPWIWHPKMPGKIAAVISKTFKIFSKPLVKLWPGSSLHTFWKIDKSSSEDN